MTNKNILPQERSQFNKFNKLQFPTNVEGQNDLASLYQHHCGYNEDEAAYASYATKQQDGDDSSESPIIVPNRQLQFDFFDEENDDSSRL